MQQVSSERALTLVENLLKKSNGNLAPADVSAATGLTVQESQDALERLMELYEARVTLREETGDILFAFSYPLHQRGKKTFREIGLTIRDTLWKGFVIVYKAAIGVVLIAYTLIFIVILIALILASASNRDSRDRDNNPMGDIIAGIFRAIFEGMQFYAWNRTIEYAIDPDGMRYRRFSGQKKTDKKNFIRSVFDFVFGPDRPQPDPLGDAKEVAAFIRSNRGKLTATHLIALAGWTYPKAEEKLADYLVRFKGHPDLTEEGIVVGEFEDFLRQENALGGGAIEWYRDETEQPWVHTGNTSGRNAAIIAMNLFNLVMSIAILSGAGDEFGVSPLIAIFLGGFPLVFSLLFFIIPLLRLPVTKQKEEQRHRTNIRKKLVGVITSQPNRAFTFEDLMVLGLVNANDTHTAKSVLGKLVPELEGSVELDTEGKAQYTFPRMARELTQ